MDSIKLLVLEELLRKDPESRVFLRLAEELRKGGQYERAIEVCKAGLPKHPGYIPAMVSLGRSSQAIGKNDEAETVFEDVLNLAPDNTHALRGLGHLLAERGEYTKALDYLEHLQLHEPNDEEIGQKIEELKGLTGSDSPEVPAWEAGKSAEPEAVDSSDVEQEMPQVSSSQEEEALQPEFEAPSEPGFEAALEPEVEAVRELEMDAGADEGMEAVPEPEEAAEPQVEIEPAPEPVMTVDAGFEAAAEPEIEAVADPELQPTEEAGENLDDSLANLDREFERAMDDPPEDPDLFMDSEALTEEFDVKTIQGDVQPAKSGSEALFDELVTRGLKHEKMEHLEEALAIYRDLLEKYPDHHVVQEHLERVQQLTKNENTQAKKIRILSNWLDKIKGVYHVS